jgi:AraC-like DNA-binding protein
MEGNFSALTVTEISAVLCRSSFDFSPMTPYRTTHTNHLVWVERGEALCQIMAQKEIANANTFLIPKGTNYRIVATGQCKLWDVAFDCKETLDKVWNADLVIPSFSKIFSSMEKIFREKADCWQYQLFASFYHAMHTLSKTYLADSHSNDPIAYQAQAYLHTHFGEHTCKVEDAAKECGVSRQYLGKIFTNRFQISPMQYLNRLRLNYAKELLAVTELSMQEVAIQSGFCDQSTFSKAFKEKIGMPPNLYRNTHSI